MTKPKSNRKVIMIAGTAATVMFAFCFAMVPLYGLICRATGINTGSINTAQLLAPVESNIKEAPDLSRTIKIQFVATNHNGMTWEFYPKTKTMFVHPGQNNQVVFYAKNTTGKKMNVQAIPSMTPTEALSHFHKLVCFCFNQQTLNGGESRDMPMVFQIDKELPKNIRVITLSYTLFDVTPKVVEKG